MPVILFSVLAFVAWLGYRIKKSTREDTNKSAQFWARESEALLTPRKSIADVKFIKVPEDIIPGAEPDIPDTDSVSGSETASEPTDDDERPADISYNARNIIESVEFDVDVDEDEKPELSEEEARERILTLSEELRHLSKAKIADLSEYTNTDLRIKYGSPNFTKLSKADANYTLLVQILPILIQSLMTVNRRSEARKLLDFCDENGISTGRLKKLREELI